MKNLMVIIAFVVGAVSSSSEALSSDPLKVIFKTETVYSKSIGESRIPLKNQRALVDGKIRDGLLEFGACDTYDGGWHKNGIVCIGSSNIGIDSRDREATCRVMNQIFSTTQDVEFGYGLRFDKSVFLVAKSLGCEVVEIH